MCLRESMTRRAVEKILFRGSREEKRPPKKSTQRTKSFDEVFLNNCWAPDSWHRAAGRISCKLFEDVRADIRAGFWQDGFCTDFCFEPPEFFTDFCAAFPLLIVVEVPSLDGPIRAKLPECSGIHPLFANHVSGHSRISLMNNENRSFSANRFGRIASIRIANRRAI